MKASIWGGGILITWMANVMFMSIVKGVFASTLRASLRLGSKCGSLRAAHYCIGLPLETTRATLGWMAATDGGQA